MENDKFENDLTKSEVNAERILRRCHVHSYDDGGVFSFITGGMGTGKTSVMLSFMDYTIKHYPSEKIFWSNTYNSPIQSLKIGLDKHHIMVKQDCGVTFHDRTKRLKQIYPNVTIFKGFSDLYQRARPGTCNCVFFGSRMLWMDFIHYLRSIGEWVHVYIDELSEISPAFTSGKLFKKIGQFSVDLKEVRKCMMNVHCNSQALPDIDHRVRTKLMIRIFLPGAKAGKDSRITQGAIDNLSEDQKGGNEAYLEFSGKFGTTIFKDIFRPIPGLQWEARTNDK